MINWLNKKITEEQMIKVGPLGVRPSGLQPLASSHPLRRSIESEQQGSSALPSYVAGLYPVNALRLYELITQCIHPVRVLEYCTRIWFFVYTLQYI